MRKKKEISRLVSALAAMLCALCFAINAVFGQESYGETAKKPAQGELKIEGKYIKQLVLEREDCNKVKFEHPGESIKLTAGKYLLREVQLEDGYICQHPGKSWMEVSEDKPAVLKVGAPLKQIVKVERQKRLLLMDYQLLGIGDEKYVKSESRKPPTFTIYKGDKKITSGTFRYG